MRAWLTMAFAAAALCGAAAAQDADAPVAVGDAVTVTARTGELTPLPSGQAVPVDLQVVAVEGAPADVPVDFTLRGFARLVEVDGRRIGQAVTDRVARADREASIDGSGLSAQFDLSDPSLAADRDVELRGDRAALLRALRRIAGAGSADGDESAARSGGSEGAGAGAAPESAGGGGGNPEASDYRPPERQASEREPQIGVEVTDEGCAVRVDLAQGVAVQQSRSVTTEDGRAVSRSECSDSSVRYPLRKDYEGCGDSVSLSSKEARPQFRWVYSDGDGEKRRASENCEPDPDLAYSIVEEHDRCDVSVDLTARTTTPQAALVYTNRANEEVEVRRCGASASRRAVDLVWDPTGCPVRSGGPGTQAVQLARLVYTLGGVSYRVGGCEDSETAYEHVKSFAGDCSDDVDLSARTARPRFRWAYRDAEGNEQFVTGVCVVDSTTRHTITEDRARCPVSVDVPNRLATPQAALVYTNRAGDVVEARGCADSESESAVALVQDPAGCEIVDDLAARESVQQAKWTYTLDGSRHEVGGCVASDTRFAHFKHYDDCDDAVDLTARQTRARFEWAYEDANGATHKVSDSCEDDDRAFPIVEDHGRCGVSINRTAKLATPQAALIYRDRNGAVVEAQGCAASGTKPAVALVRDATGCSVVHGAAGTHSVQHARWVYVLDGTRHEDGDCEATDTRFAHAKDYDCADAIDLAARKAHPRFKWFYADGEGEPRYLTGACVTETATEFAITEDHGRCSIAVDTSRGEAVPQSALIYVNRDGVTEEARACRASETRAAIPMTATAAGCSIRHDFAAGRSVQLAMWTYVLQGVTYQAAGCSDTTTTYAHEKVYRDGGAWICARTEAQSPRRVILQYRVRITVDGAARYITGCAADTSGAAVSATTTGCTDASTWRHDLSAGRSYGQERFYFAHDATRYYLGGCVESTTTYAHSATTVGWENHDAQLYALPRSKVTIAAPGGTYTIVASRVLAGAARRPYTLLRTETVSNGGVSYTGCTAYTTTVRREVYSRPDGSAYRKRVGSGSPTNPRNACTAEVTASWPRVDGSSVAHSRTGDCSIPSRCTYEPSTLGTPGLVCSRRVVKSTYAHSSRYRGTRTMRREDGHAVSTTTGTGTLANSSTYCHAGNAGSVTPANKAPAAVSDSGRISAWRSALGW